MRYLELRISKPLASLFLLVIGLIVFYIGPIIAEFLVKLLGALMIAAGIFLAIVWLFDLIERGLRRS